MNSTQPTLTVPALSFSLDNFQLRAIILDDEPWFVAADVCEALEISNPTDAIKRLDDDERARFNLGRQGDTNIISEAGLYSLIMGSRKPEAKRFKRWVTHEVLPSIRKTGGYSVKKQVPPDRQKRLCRSLMLDIARCDDKFSRDGLLEIASAAFSDAGLKLPDVKLLRPLQMPIESEGGAS